MLEETGGWTWGSQRPKDSTRKCGNLGAIWVSGESSLLHLWYKELREGAWREIGTLGDMSEDDTDEKLHCKQEKCNLSC